MWLATHTVDILTGTAVDEYGDEVDGTTVAATNVPVSILERSQRVFRYDAQDTRVIKHFAGRAPTGTPIGQGDRLRDTQSTKTWVVDRVSHPANAVIDPGLVLDLRDITA